MNSDNNGNENSKEPKKPDYEASMIRENVMRDGNAETRREKWHQFGAAFERKNGYIAIDSPLGTIMLTPREELDRMRAEREQQSQQPSRNPENEPKL